MNILRIAALKTCFPECVIGFSDHEHGFVTSHMAVALGARVFEKHITMDHTAKGTDHSFSQEFSGLAQYVKELGRAFYALEVHNQPMDEEIGPMQKMGYSLTFRVNKIMGEIVETWDLAIKSPDGGLSAWEYDNVIGKRLTRNVMSEEVLDWSFFDGEF